MFFLDFLLIYTIIRREKRMNYVIETEFLNAETDCSFGTTKRPQLFGLTSVVYNAADTNLASR